MASLYTRSGAASLILCLQVFSPLLAAAHEEHHSDDDGIMAMGTATSSEAPQPSGSLIYPPTYFAHNEYATLLYAHIVLMTIGWILILPVGVMLSLTRSKYTLFTQFVFLGVNAVGILLISVYNAKTPDLYPNNAHHTIGWIVTFVVSAQVVVGLLGKLAGTFQGYGGAESPNENHPFLPLAQASPQPDRHYFSDSYSQSDETVQGNAESQSPSLRSHSISTLNDEENLPMETIHKEYDDSNGDELEDMSLTSGSSHGRWTAKALSLATSRAWKYLDLAYEVIDRIILPFGFVAFATGIITFARFFEGSGVFGGLAHWIKGGVFFWLGLLTLGRWAGSFGEMGWAWNVSPRTDRWRPSAEFAESFLIFFYGATNIFLEHLGGSDGEWTAQDLEHISITVLFIGGGLCGMLIESTYVRALLNTTVTEAIPEDSIAREERGHVRAPDTYEFSVNPIPALVILLLGIMMGSHQQHSMISSMVHKQWGNLLTGAALARGFSYVIMYLKPPTSALPSRPPTELLASFGLISGGVIFMASAGDCITGMVHYELDAMFVYTVTLGFTGLLMSWELIVLAIKGWATRKERHRPSRYH